MENSLTFRHFLKLNYAKLLTSYKFVPQSSGYDIVSRSTKQIE